MHRILELLVAVTTVIGVAVDREPNHEGTAPSSKAQQKAPDSTNTSSALVGPRAVSVQHGEYLVHHVAMCIYCHTPRHADGTLDRDQLLGGAPMPVKSPFAGQTWAFQTPSLRGLPAGFDEASLATFLQTGKTPNGIPPRPPMPPFRMSRRDAESVVAYLKSLREGTQ